LEDIQESEVRRRRDARTEPGPKKRELGVSVFDPMSEEFIHEATRKSTKKAHECSCLLRAASCGFVDKLFPASRVELTLKIAPAAGQRVEAFEHAAQ
jgi:hypothetical protein